MTLVTAMVQIIAGKCAYRDAWKNSKNQQNTIATSGAADGLATEIPFVYLETVNSNKRFVLDASNVVTQVLNQKTIDGAITHYFPTKADYSATDWQVM